MKSWLKNPVHSVNMAALATILSAERALAAGSASTTKGLMDKITAMADKPVITLLVTGSCVAMGMLKAIDIWKAMFGGGGDGIWKDVLALLGWIILGVYWQDLLATLMAAF